MRRVSPEFRAFIDTFYCPRVEVLAVQSKRFTGVLIIHLPLSLCVCGCLLVHTERLLYRLLWLPDSNWKRFPCHLYCFRLGPLLLRICVSVPPIVVTAVDIERLLSCCPALYSISLTRAQRVGHQGLGRMMAISTNVTTLRLTVCHLESVSLNAASFQRLKQKNVCIGGATQNSSVRRFSVTPTVQT